LTKWFFLDPISEYFWNTQQHEIFLNSYQQNRALLEMKNFEEKIFFESLIDNSVDTALVEIKKSFLEESAEIFVPQSFVFEKSKSNEILVNLLEKSSQSHADLKENYFHSIKQKFQQKTLQLALQYNQETIEALSNLFADFLTFLSLLFLFRFMKPQIIILKSFLTESIYSLSDTTKSFLLILFTDLLVGFHSPRGWEFFLELLIRHFGFPENQDFIFLFVATFPVLLDTVFKYWIFRSLNKISPSTVATYHTMIE
jgi:hypothetical protein